MEIFRQLSTRREQLRLTLAQLAALTGLSAPHISNVMGGKKNAQADTLKSLGDAMNAEWMLIPKYLLPEVERLLAGKGIAPDAVPSTMDRLFGKGRDE